MKKGNDTIQFERRSEINEVINALDTFRREHPNSQEDKTVQELSNLLDIMYMEW